MQEYVPSLENLCGQFELTVEIPLKIANLARMQ